MNLHSMAKFSLPISSTRSASLYPACSSRRSWIASGFSWGINNRSGLSGNETISQQYAHIGNRVKLLALAPFTDIQLHVTRRCLRLQFSLFDPLLERSQDVLHSGSQRERQCGESSIQVVYADKVLYGERRRELLSRPRNRGVASLTLTAAWALPEVVGRTTTLPVPVVGRLALLPGFVLDRRSAGFDPNA